MKVFIVFSLPNEDDWGNQSIALAAGSLHGNTGRQYVVIDNDSSPELEPMIRSVAETLGSKVHRIEKTPGWKIVSDILTGQAMSGYAGPLLVASAADPRLTHSIVTEGLLGPPGDVTEAFVWTQDPTELMQVILAKTRSWPRGNVFEPATVVLPGETVHVPPLGNLAALLGVEPERSIRPSPGPRPPAIPEMLVRYYTEVLGPEAARFLVMLQGASQIADDFVDGDMPAAWASDAMREMLETLLLRIPNDPFYKANQAALEEAVAQCITTWSLSNDLVSDTTTETRMWCYVQRAAFQMVAWRVAALVGGLELGRKVLLDIQRMLYSRGSNSKKFATWLEEIRAREGRG